MGTECKDIIVCPMTESDIAAILAIESESFPHPWCQVHFQDELNSPYSFPLVALNREGCVIGYICPTVVMDEGHIMNVAVAKDCRGHHVGKLLVESAIRECGERGASFVSLEVRPSNVEAISLYKNMGFTETGRRKRYYENGEDALLMEYIYDNKEESGDAV